MICDKLATFADDTALNTGAAGSYIIGDQIDLSVARNIGVAIGHATLYLVIKVQTTATSGGAATGSFSLVTDDNGSLSSPTVVVSSPAYAVAGMTAGTLLLVTAIPIGATFERYIGIQQTTGTAAFTAGKIDAFLTTTPPAYKAYAQGTGAAIA